MTKQQNVLFNRAVNDIRKFCVINRFKLPKISVDDVKAKRILARGWYSWGCDTIHVIPQVCIPAAKTPGRSWHHPHCFNDMTVYGVLCHEFGHYIHCRYLLKHGRKRFNKEKPMTVYEITFDELMAEAIKMLIGNPDLMRLTTPQRYAFLTEVCGLKPIVAQNWRRRLGSKIHPRYISQCEKRITKATKRKI